MALQPLKIRFFTKQKNKNSTEHILYMRILLSGKRCDISLNYSLKKEAWDDKQQTLVGKSADRGYVLNLTNKYRQKAMEAYEQLVQRGMAYDVNIIRERVTGKNGDSFEPTLFNLFSRIIDRKIKLAGRNNSKASIQKYRRCKGHLLKFVEDHYKTDDIRFTHINLQFVEDFELYLKTDGGCCHNTTMKHVQTFKTIYKAAIAHGYTDKDPFQKYKIRMEEVVRGYLSEDEIKKLMEALLPEKLAHVRDMFLFSCHTGLAYIDLKNLCLKHLSFENGRHWIRTRRQKTSVRTNVPLLDYPKKLIELSLRDKDTDDVEQPIFDVISNQKMNDYLKELAAVCGIQKNLTFHIARHTFATTVTLNNGVPIESVSTMLGHKHISTTQHYAKMLDKKLEGDMDMLNFKLSGK